MSGLYKYNTCIMHCMYQIKYGWDFSSHPQPKKEVPNMISLLKYLLRYIITLCITIAVIFVMACVIAVIYFTVKGDIKIRRISGDEEIK